jgi:hypothetical protein
MLYGQWQGSFQGTNSGEVVFDADRQGQRAVGSAYAYDASGLPGVLVRFDLPGNVAHQTATLPVELLHPTEARLMPLAEATARFPGATFPATVQMTLQAGQRNLKITWNSSAGTQGTATLWPSKADKPSIYKGERGIRTWAQFKKFATNLEPDRFIFRGQSMGHRLRTAFHRTRRKDLLLYLFKDVPMLHRVLTAQTRHLFDLNDPRQMGAFLNLAQHHGFPTPLLDWSHSPFVAAYFAFTGDPRPSSDGRKVRILMFDRREWAARYPQLQYLTLCRPHFSLLEALAIENERAIPQQSLSTVTNVDDIETYIRAREAETGYRFLRVFDLLRSERETVERELRLMGITAASMFPGLEGACTELKRRLFN